MLISTLRHAAKGSEAGRARQSRLSSLALRPVLREDLLRDMLTRSRQVLSTQHCDEVRRIRSENRVRGIFSD